MEPRISQGNYGLLDQVAALTWVNNKISEFGGSTDEICIMGHGAGATSVSLHMISSMSKGKFKRSIAMSGSAFSTSLPSIPDMQPYKDIKSQFCDDGKTSKDFMECLGNIKALPLVEYAWNKYEWGPVVDFNDNFLPKHPEDLFQAAEYHKVCSIIFNATYFL
jgi:carboxylesterase type B